MERDAMRHKVTLYRCKTVIVDCPAQSYAFFVGVSEDECRKMVAEGRLHGIRCRECVDEMHHKLQIVSIKKDMI